MISWENFEKEVRLARPLEVETLLFGAYNELAACFQALPGGSGFRPVELPERFEPTTVSSGSVRAWPIGRFASVVATLKAVTPYCRVWSAEEPAGFRFTTWAEQLASLDTGDGSALPDLEADTLRLRPRFDVRVAVTFYRLLNAFRFVSPYTAAERERSEAASPGGYSNLGVRHVGGIAHCMAKYAWLYTDRGEYTGPDGARVPVAYDTGAYDYGTIKSRMADLWELASEYVTSLFYESMAIWESRASYTLSSGSSSYMGRDLTTGYRFDRTSGAAKTFPERRAFLKVRLRRVMEYQGHSRDPWLDVNRRSEADLPESGWFAVPGGAETGWNFPEAWIPELDPSPRLSGDGVVWTTAASSIVDLSEVVYDLASSGEYFKPAGAEPSPDSQSGES